MAGVVREDVARSLRPEVIGSAASSGWLGDVGGLKLLEPVGSSPARRPRAHVQRSSEQGEPLTRATIADTVGDLLPTRSRSHETTSTTIISTTLTSSPWHPLE